MPALVMNCLAPSITQSPSSSVARVRTLPASRARLGLGQPEGAELAARAQVGQAALLLLLGAEQVDRLGAERRVRAHRDRHARVDARELLDGERVGERVAAAAAVLLRERDPHQPELAELARRSRRGSASRGRAPPRRARPRPRRSRGRCGGSARGRRRGRSPCAAAYRMIVRISNDHSKYARLRACPRPDPSRPARALRPPPRPRSCSRRGARVRRARLRPDVDARARRRRSASRPAASTTTSAARSSCCSAICDQLMDPLLERARGAARRAARAGRAAARARAPVGRARRRRTATTCSSSSRSAT